MTTGAMLDARVRELELTIKELEAELSTTKGKLYMMETMYLKESKRADMYYRWTIAVSELIADMNNVLVKAANVFDNDEQHQAATKTPQDEQNLQAVEQAITGVDHGKDGKQ